MRLLTRIPAWVGVSFDAVSCYDRSGWLMHAYVPLFFKTIRYEWYVPGSKLL